MKKNFVLGVSLLVLMFGLVSIGCASTSKNPLGNLTSAEMNLDDPRMPPDMFIKKGKDIYLVRYWVGSLETGLPRDKQSFFSFSKAIHSLSIDGVRINKPSDNDNNAYLILAPGKHVLDVTYLEYRNIKAYNGTDLGDLRIYIPDERFEADMEPGKMYSFGAKITDTSNLGEVIGLGRRQYSSSLVLGSSTPEPNPPLKDDMCKYLEPYDSSYPLGKQAFLTTSFGINIVKFDGNSVLWGWPEGTVTIGIPDGKHQLGLVYKGILYEVTLDCFSEHRYEVELDNNERLRVRNTLRGVSIVPTKIGKYKP